MILLGKANLSVRTAHSHARKARLVAISSGTESDRHRQEMAGFKGDGGDAGWSTVGG